MTYIRKVYFVLCLDARTMLHTNSLLPSAAQYANCLLHLPLSNRESLPLLAMDMQWAEHRSIETLSVHNDLLNETSRKKKALRIWWEMVADTRSREDVNEWYRNHDLHNDTSTRNMTDMLRHACGIADVVTFWDRCPEACCCVESRWNNAPAGRLKMSSQVMGTNERRCCCDL